MTAHIRAEIEVSPLYALAQEFAREAETVWCKAATRENTLDRRNPNRRHEYSAAELFAEAILELIGSPIGVMDEQVEAIVSRLGEREQSEAA